MIGYARARSPFYRKLYADLPSGAADPGVLPPVTKPQLMEHFDEVVTDRSVTRAAVEEFLADPGNVGQPFMGRYLVATSSGSTGHPGVFMQDELARVLADVLPRIRGGLTNWYGLREALRFIRSGGRYALLDVGGGPHGALVASMWAQRENPRLAHTIRFISVLDSLDQQAGELNQFQPQALGGYPSAILLLAREQAAGLLHIKPLFIIFVGENVPASARRFIEETFGCRSYEEYGSTENGVMAVQCREGWLHYNADWYLLEPVDTSYRPVPAGARSDTVLVTNLTNRLLPTIRYDQGDCILLKPDPCTCGSAYPAIRVTGRTDDLLNLPARSGGGIVTVTPLSLVAAIEEVPGVYRIQIVHRTPDDLEFRLQVLPGADEDAVWSAVTTRAHRHLGEQGAGPVTLHRSPEPPLQHPQSGKYAQVINLREQAASPPRPMTSSRTRNQRGYLRPMGRGAEHRRRSYGGSGVGDGGFVAAVAEAWHRRPALGRPTCRPSACYG